MAGPARQRALATVWHKWRDRETDGRMERGDNSWSEWHRASDFGQYGFNRNVVVLQDLVRQHCERKTRSVQHWNDSSASATDFAEMQGCVPFSSGFGISVADVLI